MQEQEIDHWITWRGKHLPVDKDGNIIKFSNDEKEFDFVDEDKYYELMENCYDNSDRNANKIFNSVYCGTEMSLEINKALREDDKKILNVYEDDIKVMDKAINNYKIPQDLKVIRGVDSEYLINAYKANIQSTAEDTAKGYSNKIPVSRMAKEMKQFIGTEMYSKSYTSTSMSESGSWYVSNLKIKMQIDIPKGTKCFIPDNPQEQELILGRNQKMILKDVKIEHNNRSDDAEYNDYYYDKLLLKYEVVDDE